MPKYALAAIVAVATTMANCGFAFAGANRTFVSTAGVDSGTCAVASPCRSFAYAITQTNPNGELVALATGGYGPVTITQAVSIVASPGAQAFISAPSGNAITVAAGPTDAVSLSGLYLDGFGTSRIGISVLSASSVRLTSSIVTGFTYGIYYKPNVPANAPEPWALTIADSSFHTNLWYSLFVDPSGSGAPSGNSIILTLRSTSMSNAGLNINNGEQPVRGTVQALIDKCSFSGMETALHVLASGPPLTTVKVFRSTISSVKFAVFAVGAASVGLDGTSISGAATVATVYDGATINSFGNNGLFANGSVGALTTVPLQ